MIYYMNRDQYNLLNITLTHEEILDYVNERLGNPVDKQTGINIVDHVNEKKERIDFETIGITPMRLITDVRIY